jgi:hypothetical protein
VHRIAFMIGAVCLVSGCGPAAGTPGTPCDPSQPCAAGGACVIGRCRPSDTAPVAADAARLVLRPSDMAVISSRADEDQHAETIAVGRASLGSLVVLLRYAPTWREEAEVSAAFVVLEPLAGAPPAQSAVRVEVTRILEPWSGETTSWGRQPRLGLPAPGATVRPAPPAPLRIDVTEIVRSWARRGDDAHGIALLASGGDPYGAVFTTGLTGGRAPELEVYVR